uniref:Peptidase_S24 domain-containing protein n=1 Tax=Heterorhabditis bacteriophora TaxID=37862 RepID=A0A1I7X9Q6_HETBA
MKQHEGQYLVYHNEAATTKLLIMGDVITVRTRKVLSNRLLYRKQMVSAGKK